MGTASITRPRLITIPVADWADARDVEYARWKYTTKQGFDYDAALAETPALLEEAAGLLRELVPMLRGAAQPGGAPCLNAWGLSVDDVLLLPVLRNLSCVRGLEWPPAVREYLERHCERANVSLYFEHAS